MRAKILLFHDYYQTKNHKQTIWVDVYFFIYKFFYFRNKFFNKILNMT